jgi:hypothetical protein
MALTPSPALTSVIIRLMESNMPLFMDIHRNVDGLSAEALIQAHKKDLEVQPKYGVRYLNYWYSEPEKAVFCLVEAPNSAAAAAVHREAHGLLAQEVIEVKQGVK